MIRMSPLASLHRRWGGAGQPGRQRPRSPRQNTSASGLDAPLQSLSEGGRSERFCRRALTISGMPTAAPTTARPISTHPHEGSPDVVVSVPEAGGVADAELGDRVGWVVSDGVEVVVG